MSRARLFAFAVAVYLCVLAGCAGMRFGVFGGYLDQSGVIAGTPAGGPIDTESGGAFGGVMLSGELTPPSRPRASLLERAYDYDEAADRYSDEPERGVYGPSPVAEAKGGIDFAGPLALSLYSLVTIVAGLAIKLLGADAPSPTPPQ